MSYEDMLTKQGNFGRQQNYYPNPRTYTAIGPTEAKDLYHFADGGPVEQMSNQAAMGLNTMYPMANMSTSSFATPYQSPVSTNMLSQASDTPVGMNGEPSMQGTRLAEGGEAEGPVVESRPSYTYDAKNQKYTAGPAIGGANNAPQDFGASAGQAIDNFAEGVARDGLTTPMGSYIPPSVGVPSYVYNPQTREYQQLAGGGLSVSELVKQMMGQKEKDVMEESTKYEYNADGQQYQPMATGGISDAHYNLGGYSDGGRLLRSR
jgi:hypothetical protein